jgi:hypothetical protein
MITGLGPKDAYETIAMIIIYDHGPLCRSLSWPESASTIPSAGWGRAGPYLCDLFSGEDPAQFVLTVEKADQFVLGRLGLDFSLQFVKFTPDLPVP